MSPRKKAPTGYRNRIVGHGEEAPDQLLANPKNWRVHPMSQQDALSAVMDRVGWVQQVVVNKQTGFVVDGHLRVALAISKNEPSVPVTYVDLSEEEEALVLATFDPLSAMAGTDKDLLGELLAGLDEDGAVGELLNQLAGEQGVLPTEPGTRQLSSPVIGYQLIFDSEEQQGRWFEWLRALKVKHPDVETIAGRIDVALSKWSD